MKLGYKGRIIAAFHRGEKSMWSKRRRRFCFLMLLAVAASAAGCHTQPISDHGVISAIVAAMNEEDDKSLAAAKEDLAASTKKLSSELTECHNHAEAGCTYNNTGPGDPTWCFPNLYCQKTRDACIENTEKYFCGNDDRRDMDFQTNYYPVLKAIVDDYHNIVDDRAEIAKDESQIASFTYRSRQYVMTVEGTYNYEGTIISYVNFRTKGTDSTERYKVTIKLRLQDRTWVVVSTEPAPSGSG
jgi:hypothetical protein